MKAVIKSGPGIGLELIEVPIPSVGPSDVLVKIKAATICGSDFPIYNWNDAWTRDTVKPGQIIGHEFCGVVVNFGENVTDLSAGELVTAEGHIHCGHCYHCKTGESHLCPHQKVFGFNYPGIFAEYVVIPYSNVIRLGNMPLVIGALQDPFGCAVHSISKVNLANSTVLITGCGPIGLMTIALSKFAGSQYIFATEKSQYRSSLALNFGANIVYNPDTDNITSSIIEKTYLTAGVDIFFEMSGTADGLRQGFSALRPGGTAVLLGLPREPVVFDFANDLIAKGITVYGTIGRTMFKTWHQSRRLVESKSIDLPMLVTHRFLLDDFDLAFNLMQKGDAGKVMLFPDEESLQQSFDEIP